MADITKGWQQAAKNVRDMMETKQKREALAAQKQLGDLRQEIALKELDLANREHKLNVFTQLSQSGLAKFDLGPLAKELETDMLSGLREKPLSSPGALTFEEQKQLAETRSGFRMQEIEATGQIQKGLAATRGDIKAKAQKKRLSVEQQKIHAKLAAQFHKEMAESDEVVEAVYNVALAMGSAPKKDPTEKVAKAEKKGLIKIGKRDVEASEIYARLGKDENTGEFVADIPNEVTGISPMNVLSDYSTEMKKSISPEKKANMAKWIQKYYPELSDYIVVEK